MDALSDPIKRRDYDARLKQEEESAAAGRTSGSRTGPSAAGSGGTRTASGGGPAPFSEDRAWSVTEMEMACRSCGRTHTCTITEIPS